MVTDYPLINRGCSTTIRDWMAYWRSCGCNVCADERGRLYATGQLSARRLYRLRRTRAAQRR